MTIKIGFPYRSHGDKCDARWYPLEKEPDIRGEIKVLYKVFNCGHEKQTTFKLLLSYFGSSIDDFAPLIPCFIEIYDCKLSRKIYPEAKPIENNKLILEL